MKFYNLIDRITPLKDISPLKEILIGREHQFIYLHLYQPLRAYRSLDPRPPTYTIRSYPTKKHLIETIYQKHQAIP